MKLLLQSFVILFTLVSCQNASQSVNSDLSKYTLTPIPGSDLQSATFTNKANEVLEEGFVLNGMKEGQWCSFGTNGEVLLKVENYHRGQLMGHVLELNPRFELEKRSAYINGLQEGYHAEYKRSRKKMEAYYKEGKRHGRMTQYHDYSDKILSEADYMNGKQHGIYKYYDKSGNVTLDYEYKNGEKVRGGIVEKE